MSHATIPAVHGECIRICIAGSRTISDYSLFRKLFLAYIEQFRGYDLVIVTGMAKDGPDDMAYHLARWDLNIPWEEHRADWKKYGNSAGMIRNAEMVEVSEQLFMLWDGVSKGSKHMLESCKAKGLGVELHVLDPEHLNHDIEIFTFDD